MEGIFAGGFDRAQHQAEAAGPEDDGGWEEVPGVFRDYVGGEEVDFAGGVAAIAPLIGLEGTEIAVADFVVGGFDLYAQEDAVVFDAYIVGGGVAPRVLTP